QNNVGRIFKREYSLGGLFIASDFTKNISIKNKHKHTTLIEELIKENHLVFITNLTHMSGLIKHKNYYYFYNCNASDGWLVFAKNELTELAAAIFAAFNFELKKYSPLCFNIIRPKGVAPSNYLSQAVLLKAIKQPRVIKSKYDDENEN